MKYEQLCGDHDYIMDYSEYNAEQFSVSCGMGSEITVSLNIPQDVIRVIVCRYEGPCIEICQRNTYKLSSPEGSRIHHNLVQQMPEHLKKMWAPLQEN